LLISKSVEVIIVWFVQLVAGFELYLFVRINNKEHQYSIEKGRDMGKTYHFIAVGIAFAAFAAGYILGLGQPDSAKDKATIVSDAKQPANHQPASQSPSENRPELNNKKQLVTTSNKPVLALQPAEKPTKSMVISDPRMLDAIRRQQQNRPITGEIDFDWNDTEQWQLHIEDELFADTNHGILQGKAEIDRVSCDKGRCEASLRFYESSNSAMMTSKYLKSLQNRADIVGIDKSAQVLLKSMKKNVEGLPVVEIMFEKGAP
jgi:hypothetical protein